MPRTTLLLGMVAMLAVANSFPSYVWQPGLPGAGTENESTASIAFGEPFCYNCSGLTTSPLAESTGGPLSSSQLLPGSSPIITTPGSIQSEEEDAWIWRGKVKSRWESVGFDSGIFELFMRMKGAKTRLSLLEALSTPKDRMRLAQELALDWKAVDYHIVRLNKCGLIREDLVFGKVKLYRLTTSGETLLQLLGEFGVPDSYNPRRWSSEYGPAPKTKKTSASAIMNTSTS